MWQLLVSGLKVGIRGRSFHAVFLFGVFLILVAYLSGSFSPRQPRTIALDVGLSGLRLTLILLALFWVQELLAREIDRRVILFSLTYPISRAGFVAARLGAIFVLIALASVVLGLALTIAVIFSGSHYTQEFPVSLGLPMWLTIAGLALDVAVVATVGFCIASLSTVSVLPLAVGFAFAIAGKALGATLEYLQAGADGDAQLVSQWGATLDAIRWVIPDLSRLDWRTWPLYGALPDGRDVFLAVLMALSYIAIMAAVAIHSLSKREFS